MSLDQLAVKTYTSAQEESPRREMAELLKSCPIPEDQLLPNLGLFLESKNLARILFMDFLFRQIVEVPGVIIELGTRWGQNLALFSALRGIYDPFNWHRRIIGFDTFAGFPAISAQDGASDMMRPGQLAVTEGYERFLSRLLQLHEQLNPISHIRKYELRVGDAAAEVGKYLQDAPQTVIALAYFDLDLYQPTKQCLEIVRPRLTKGSVIAFDELNDADWPGETLALIETFGLNNVQLRRWPHASRTSYFVMR